MTLEPSGATIGAILLATAIVPLIETAIPLHSGRRASRAHPSKQTLRGLLTLPIRLRDKKQAEEVTA